MERVVAVAVLCVAADTSKSSETRECGFEEVVHGIKFEVAVEDMVAFMVQI